MAKAEIRMGFGGQRRCGSYLSSVKILSPQNGGFIRASLVVPDSYGREFRAVARSATKFFLSNKVYKKI